MRSVFILLILVFQVTASYAQLVFRTMVSQQPIVAGESFAVQYVLENTPDNDGFSPPLFKGLKLISGPDRYEGVSYGVDGPVSLKNIVFTLVAPTTGWVTIPGATARINGRIVKSNDVLIEVITRAEANDLTRREPQSQSEYFLRPGEDPNEKLRKNLFMRVSVDKQVCFVGEPVLATFKLYSRLESRSDIVKNPGFYGFTVHDVLNLNDKHSATEIVNGKLFDVHTVRMVQLYPLQAGNYTIDAMEISNKVEFSKTGINKKTEQKIVEGVFEKTNTTGRNNTVTVENTISTTPIAITVKKLPEENKPDTYAGATGKFTISASIKKTELSKNEQGTLLITLEGKGNFVQLEAPTVRWPEGIEGFAPQTMDSLDKSQVPLEGTRTFSFPFVISKPGEYLIPPVTFTFFNPDSNKYKTISTKDVSVKILATEKHSNTEIGNTTSSSHGNKSPRLVWLAAIFSGIVIVVLALHFYNSRRKKIKVQPVVEPPVRRLSVDEEFEMAFEAMRIGDAAFYNLLQKSTWTYLAKRYDLAGSELNKSNLKKVLESNSVDTKIQDELIDLIGQCEIATFTKAEPAMGKKRLLFRIKETLRGI